MKAKVRPLVEPKTWRELCPGMVGWEPTHGQFLVVSDGIVNDRILYVSLNTFRVRFMEPWKEFKGELLGYLDIEGGTE